MSRNLSPAMVNAVTGQVHHPLFLVKCEFASGTTRVWTGTGTISYASEDYLGLGHLLGVDLPEEASDGAANGATLTLSGVDSSWNSLVYNENYQGRACSIFYGELTDAGVLIADPILIFKGVMDVMTVVDGRQTSNISLTVERRTLDPRPVGGRYDHQDQLRRYPGDLGLQYMAGIQEKEVFWGGKREGGGTGGSAPGGGPAPGSFGSFQYTGTGRGRFGRG